LSGPCPKAVLAVFGGLFLIALLAVPVVTMITAERRDPGSRIVFRLTFPRKSTMFLPSYLSRKDDPGESGAVRLRAAQWTGRMALVAVLGIFDYFVVCRLLLRRGGRQPDDADAADVEDKASPSRSGFDLFP
jgi:hypothetical protein